MQYILDIETKANKNLIPIYTDRIKAPANIKDPEKIKTILEKKKKEAEGKMAVDTDFSDIICIGIKKIGGDSKILTPKELEDWFKERILERKIDNQNIVNYNFEFITFNGKQFDLPILIKYGLCNGLEYPYKKLMDMTKKWKDNGHYDLMEILAFGGGFKSLDTYLQIFCDVKKTPIDFEVATAEEIKKHCLEDLENTEKLYNKFKPLI